ncbi:MAG: hypothetical protein DCC65_05750 [Planctomycetota bacterium]|nr:MAG: hypothetical protein DCC65_05750 [Planctomycetota bacterium]
MLESTLLYQLLLVPVLMGINAFFVASEYAVVTIRSTRIEEMKSDGHAVARVLGRLKADMSGSLAAIQICITGTNLLLGAVAEPAMTQLIVGALSPLKVVLPMTVARPLALALGMILVTLFTVVLSELLPKALTLQYTEQIAVAVARPVALSRVVCAPLVFVMNRMGNAITRTFGLGDVQIVEPVHSEEELEMLVDRAEAAGEFHEQHGDILRRAFDFADMVVRHVTIPMSRVGALDAHATVEEVARNITDWPYTRWPIRDGRSGRVTGIVNIKALLHVLALDAAHTLIMEDVADEPLVFDPDLPLVDALTEMRRRRRHLAVVREGDGPDLGIVTLEDILGSLVGKIPGESKRNPS